MSAITKFFSSSTATTPSTGVIVVKWYSAISGRADETQEMMLDLPTLGYPTRPTSARSFISRRSSFCSPGSPSSAKVGALLRLDANFALPRPPRPPRAMTSRWPFSVMSAKTSPVFASLTIVPGGTLTMQGGAQAPNWFLMSPFSPFCPRNFR